VITALHDSKNELIGFSKVTRDLTERKLAEDKMIEYARTLELKNAELMKSNKELESFNYICSHDLQEPLRKIQSFSTRILDQEYATLSEKGQLYFNRMASAANRMQHLIEDLLALSRATGTGATIEEVDFKYRAGRDEEHFA
jgi:light-regulated signal transduction histidine kinase (bacteriophytochrome)